MHNSESKDTFTVKISFVSSGKENRAPIPANDMYVKIPLGLSLPHVGESIGIDDILYTVKNRALLLSNAVVRDAFWNLLVEKAI